MHGGKAVILCLLCSVGFSQVQGQKKELLDLYTWKYFDYVWDSAEQRQDAINSGTYDYRNVIPIDVDMWHDKVFVTIIRDKGVPASLNVISNQKGEGGPLLQPYPDWSWAKQGDCNGITSVYRVAIDQCNRLWVLDTGKTGETQTCPPQLLTFDLHTDKLIKRAKIPLDVAQNKTGSGLLVTPIVHAYGSNCRTTYVYIADTEGYGLIVHDGRTFWRKESPLFRPDPKYTDYTIRNESFHLDDGLLGMAIAPGPTESRRKLYLRALSSVDLNSVPVTNVQYSRWYPTLELYNHKKVFSSQVTALAFSSDGTLFASPVEQTELVCWNHRYPLDKQHVITLVHDEERLQFASGIKVIRSNVTDSSEQLYIMTNRLQKVYNNSMNFTETNFRILTANVKELVADTDCARTYTPYQTGYCY